MNPICETGLYKPSQILSNPERWAKKATWLNHQGAEENDWRHVCRVDLFGSILWAYGGTDDFRFALGRVKTILMADGMDWWNDQASHDELMKLLIQADI